MESNLLLEQYSWYKKQQLAKAPFECLLNADIEPNPHQVNAFCAAIQALKTGGIILADEVGLGKTIEAGLVLNYVLDNGAKKVLISLPATLRKQWEVELLEKFGRQAVILDRYTVEHKLMLQSLSPLAFLTIVRNFKFTPVSELAENQSYWGEFVRLNNVRVYPEFCVNVLRECKQQKLV